MGLELIGPRLAAADTIAKREALLGLTDVVVVDSFDRVTSTTTLGNADTGQAWTASQVGIVSGRMKATAAVAAGFSAFLDAGAGNGNAEISAVIRRGASQGVGLAFRATDASNGLFALINTAGTALNVYKRVAGVNTSLATVAVVWPDTLAMPLKVVVRNDIVKVFFDGVLVLTWTLIAGDFTAFPVTLTKYGMYFGATDASSTFDNFTVKTLA